MEKFNAEMARKQTKTKDEIAFIAIETQIKNAVKRGIIRLRFEKNKNFDSVWPAIKEEFESRGFNCVETKKEYQINWI